MSESTFDLTADIDTIMLTLRKPTELKKVFESVPKPSKAVPKNGLPVWYKLGLDAKLPVPKMPKGKIVFARGRIGENIRRFAYPEGPTEFNNMDPYCAELKMATYSLSHDPHLASHFARPLVRKKMMELGEVTSDGRAVCRLADFNAFRKFLFFQYMDRVHVEVEKVIERGEDSLALRRAEHATRRRFTVYIRSERERVRHERVALQRAEEEAEKMRLAKEQQKKVKKRMQHFAEFREKQREECAERAREKAEQVKRRVAAADEKELRRTVTLLRIWRRNEKKRTARLQSEKETREKMIQEQANTKWQMRIEAENRKMAQEKLLTKIYTDVMAYNTNMRIKKAETYEYNNELNYQQLRMTNLRKARSDPALLIRKMGLLFEETKRGSKGMSVALALGLADVAVNHAISVTGNPFLGMCRARGRMELETNLPTGVLRLIDEMIETAMMEFIRGHATHLLYDVETHCYDHFKDMYLGEPKKRKPKVSRWLKATQTTEVEPLQSTAAGSKGEPRKVTFGNVRFREPDDAMSDIETYPTKNRPPTPYPSTDEVAELAFLDKPDDIPSPTAVGPSSLPEKEKMLEDLVRAGNLLIRFIIASVLKGVHLPSWKITMPPIRHTMEWGEVVECMSKLLMNSQIEAYNPELRRVGDFLTRRIMHFLQVFIKEDREMKKHPPPPPVVEEEQQPEQQPVKKKKQKDVNVNAEA